MKTQDLKVIALLLGTSEALGLDPLPVMTGTIPVYANTLSCAKCIRSGYIWCSSQWYYQSATTTYDPTAELGKCCFNTANGAYTQGGGTLAKEDANNANCPAKYTNSSSDSIVTPNVTAAWCSYDTSLPELAITVCRQAQSICGSTVNYVALDTTSAVQAIAVSTITNDEKCTWVMKATLGAPAFQVTSTAAEVTSAGIASDYDIHYIEYTDTTTLRDATYYIKFDEDQATTSTNKIRASYYDKDQFGGITLPDIYTYVNPSASANRRKRWFPGQFIERDILDYKSRVTFYEGLLTAYNTERTAYDDKVKEANKYVDPWTKTFGTIAATAIPLRPAAPTQTAEYSGYLFSSTVTYTTVTTSNQILLWAEDYATENRGGWGQITMGLLKPAGLNGRSFGMLGQAEKVTTGTVYDPTTQGYIGQTPYTKMAATTALGGKPQYLMISLWANNYAGAAQSVTTFNFEFKSVAWGTYSTTWAVPAQPTKAMDPISGAAASELSAKMLGVSMVSAFTLAYLQ